MIINEIYEKVPAAYQDLEADNTQLKASDLRKTRLTLRQIHKLRLMSDTKAVEYKEKLKLVRQQYAPAPVEPGF